MLFRNFFDHPLTLLVVVLLIVVIFGAKRLPDVSRSLARSMRIFKSEVREMKEEDRAASGSSAKPGTPTHPLEGRVVDEDARAAANAGARPVADETTTEQRRGA